jgi:hypothetical protein
MIKLATVLQAYTQSPTHTSKPYTLQDLRRETEIACATAPLSTTENVCQSVARRFQQCIAAGSEHFEHL